MTEVQQSIIKDIDTIDEKVDPMNHTSDQSRALAMAAAAKTYHYSVFDENGIAYKTPDGQVVFTRTEAERYAKHLQSTGVCAECRDISTIPNIKRREASRLKEWSIGFAFWFALVAALMLLGGAVEWFASSHFGQ